MWWEFTWLLKAGERRDCSGQAEARSSCWTEKGALHGVHDEPD